MPLHTLATENDPEDPPILDDLKLLVATGDISKALAQRLTRELLTSYGCVLQPQDSQPHEAPDDTEMEEAAQYKGGVNGEVADPD